MYAENQIVCSQASLSKAKRFTILCLAMGSLPGGYCREVISIAAIAVEHERAMASQACRPTSTLQNSPTMPPTRFPPTMRSHKACVAVTICVPWPHSMQATDIAACLCSCHAHLSKLNFLCIHTKSALPDCVHNSKLPCTCGKIWHAAQYAAKLYKCKPQLQQQMCYTDRLRTVTDAVT